MSQFDVTVQNQSHVTVSCHSVMSQFHVTVSCHIVMSQCHVTDSCHRVMSQYHVTVSCHRLLSQSHITESCHSIMSQCHVYLTSHYHSRSGRQCALAGPAGLPAGGRQDVHTVPDGSRPHRLRRPLAVWHPVREGFIWFYTVTWTFSSQNGLIFHTLFWRMFKMCVEWSNL